MDYFFLYDQLFIMCIYVFGVISVLTAYHLGHRTWKTRFKIKVEKQDKSHRYIRGQWGEIGSLTMVCGLLLLIDYLTPDALIYTFFSGYTGYVTASIVVIALGIYIYSLKVCSSVKSNEGRSHTYCRRLKRGYIVYNGYSLVMYSSIVLLVVLIICQFLAETHRFEASNNELFSLLNNFHKFRNPSPEFAISHAEIVYGRTILGSTIIMSQIGTLLLISLTAFLAYFVITFTPLSQVYEKGAVKSVHMAFIGSLAIVGILAWVIYFTTYSDFYDRTISQLVTYRSLIETGSGEDISAYNRLMLDLHKHRGPTGFIWTLTNESGWVVIAFGAIRWLWGRRTSAA